MKNGFAVLSVAGRNKDGEAEILAQRVCYSTHADREMNMRLFADSAAGLCLEAMGGSPPVQTAHKESVPVGSNLFLDRSSYLRSDASAMQDFYQQKDALHVIIRGTDEVLFASTTELALPTYPELVELLEACGADEKEVIPKRTFLGRLGQTPVFATFLDSACDGDCGGWYFAQTRPRAPLLNALHNELALTATAYVNWQKAHQYCCECGAPLEFIQGNTCAKCTATSGKPHFHWPRQDPSIIVLVTNPQRTHALLARSPRHPDYLYTAIAGFVEAGETFESAVTREVHEGEHHFHSSFLIHCKSGII